MTPMTKSQKVWCWAVGLWLIALLAALAPEEPVVPAATVAVPTAPVATPLAIAPAAPKESPTPLTQATSVPPVDPLAPAWLVEPNFRQGLEDEILAMRAKRAIQPRQGFLHEEEVSWARYEDFTGANLEDGRSMHLGKGSVDLAVAIAWKTGTKLLLCYSESDGVLLIEPIGGVIFKVDVVFGSHPLDAYQKAMEEHVSTTVDTIALTNEMNKLWGFEADRCVREVLEHPHAPAFVKENLIRLTHARKAFSDAYNRHLGACLQAFYGGGTMRFWDHAGIGRSESREFAQQLLAVRYQARFFEAPEKSEEGK